MWRTLFASLAGAVFGLGLVLSGMTDTLRVQGWLDFTGCWDPTLGFVLAGAILPMVLAWRLAAGRSLSALGTPFPPPPDTRLGAPLLVGSVLFGMGWALAGLCPGPALASASFGGWGGLLFILAMLAGMLGAPAARRLVESASERSKKGSKMEIRQLTDSYAVSPQIMPEDVAALKAAGFVRVICNRPDGENPPALQAAEMRRHVESAGMEFVENPVTPGQFTPDLIARQSKAMQAPGPVFAYCASGNRSSVVWALTQAGHQPADALIATAARWGYNLEPFRAMLG